MYLTFSRMHRSLTRGYKVDSGIGLSYQLISLCSLAGRYDNPRWRSWHYPPIQGLWIWLLTISDLSWSLGADPLFSILVSSPLCSSTQRTDCYWYEDWFLSFQAFTKNTTHPRTQIWRQDLFQYLMKGEQRIEPQINLRSSWACWAVIL